jgi:hypothetical protein
MPRDAQRALDLWIKDLSAPDPFFYLARRVTSHHHAANGAESGKLQTKLMWFMPLIFSVMFSSSRLDWCSTGSEQHFVDCSAVGYQCPDGCSPRNSTCQKFK